MKRMTHNEVVACSKARAIMETQLCTEMYALYNSGPILNPIRTVVALAIEQILGMMQFNTLKTSVGWDVAVKKAGGNLAVWRLSGSAPKETSAGLMKVWENSARWTADDCGDLIRLFGGMIEDTALQQGGAVNSDVDAIRGSKRKAGFGSTRARFTDGFVVTDAHIGGAHNAVLGAKRVPGGFSGIQKVRLKEQSTVKKIDCAYGLAEGCDISGTTADSIFFFDYVNAFIKGLPEMIASSDVPVIQLFPMATMGSQGHHTVLECALTLTQNEIIDYRVGFYSTLMPSGSKNPLLQRLFSKYENDVRNVQMLCWWDEQGGKLNGVRFDKFWEIQMLKDNSLADPTLLQDFTNIGIRASKKQIMSMRRYSVLGRLLGIA